jgi:hypothetical protein
MKEFMMIFRMAPMADFQPTPEQMQESIKQWQDWIGGIAAQGKFSSTNQLGFTGKTLKADGVVTDGPYAEVKEIVGGYIIVNANDIDDALELAKGCPILFIGGHVEVRDIMQINL